MLETTTDGSRMTNARAGFALAAVVTIALFAIVHVATGRPPRPSFFLIVIVIVSSAAMWVSKITLLRLAFAMGGIQAAVRLVLWLAHARYIWQWIVAVSGEVTIAFAAILGIFVIVRWLRCSAGGQPSSDRENSIP